jgi:hypothetical protein
VKGLLRGLHYQLAPYAQGKLVRVVQGAVFDVAVDIRKSSPNFGKWAGALLSADNKQQLWVPPGFAHGFVTLSDTAEFLTRPSSYIKRPIRTRRKQSAASRGTTRRLAWVGSTPKPLSCQPKICKVRRWQRPRFLNNGLRVRDGRWVERSFASDYSKSTGNMSQWRLWLSLSVEQDIVNILCWTAHNFGQMQAKFYAAWIWLGTYRQKICSTELLMIDA